MWVERTEMVKKVHSPTGRKNRENRMPPTKLSCRPRNLRLDKFESILLRKERQKNSYPGTLSHLTLDLDRPALSFSQSLGNR